MRRLLKIFKYFFIAVAAIILVTVGIDAADNYDRFSESIVGRLVFGEPEGPCPDGMAFVPSENGGFCIDKYENSPGDKCPNQETGDQGMTRDNLNSKECAPVSLAGSVPWRFISQSQAVTACAKAGKRLPTEEEWYLASLGTPDKESGWTESDCQVKNNWLLQPGPAGAGADCISSAGAYDMIGNVWEWVKGEAVDGFYDGKELPKSGYVAEIDQKGIPVATDPEIADPNFNSDYFWIKNTGNRSLARGGYWDNKSEAGVYASYLVSPGTFAGTGIGFRCVK